MPLPSIAANDPYFRNISGNNWSGQPESLTFQRSIQALENYGHYAELTMIGQKFLKSVGDSLKFTQQFDPFTATITKNLDGYGPCILASLEFISRMHGVHLTQDRVYWSCLNTPNDFEYEQTWGNQVFTLRTNGNKVACLINDKEVFSFTKGVRVVSDLDGKPTEVVGIATEVQKADIVYDGRAFSLNVAPNTVYSFAGTFRKDREVPFYNPDAATAQFDSYPESYKIDQEDIDRAHRIISNPLKKPVIMPNPNPAAQWFPDASLGLFMHWGIHSVAGAQPSWDMISNYKYGGKVAPPDKYYALANQFDPQNYDPAKWLNAAKEAGFKYAVLTTKHHDGYALWPSKYGIGTRQYMNGRDLLKPYVDACRAGGLKVGFYFSPRDWHYPGLMHPNEFDALTRSDIPPITDSISNYQDYERFLGFVLAQMEEILTRYGKIDLLWLDGMSFRGVGEMHTEQIYAWIRSLQPEMVINDRWSNIVNPDDPAGSGVRIGDFTTPFECSKPTYVPSKWWEHCDIWTCGGGGWGYDKTGTFRPYSWFFEHLVACRSLGGNFLPNVGPAANGEMHPNYYRQMAGIAEWMKHSKESVIGAGPSPGVERSNVMITTRNNSWYLHLLPDFKKQVSLKTDKQPKSLTLVRTGTAIPYNYFEGVVKFTVPENLRTELDDVVKVEF